jgi:hypothetical protein
VRFEIQFPEGVPHEVELQGRLVVVGRDPSCDLVLHDVKCSRRHAVLEAGPDGITVRDTGSANGVFVNDEKVDRSPLKAGDVLRLGDSVVRVLPEEVEGTVVMGPGETSVGEATIGEDAQPPPLPRRVPPPAPPRAAAPPAPAPVTPPPLPPRSDPEPVVHRPLTVNVLAALWLMSVPVYALGGAALAMRASGLAAFTWAVIGASLAALGGALAWGLWSLKPWARGLQIAVAGLGLLVCPFTLASGTVLGYMLAPVGAAAFAGRLAGDERAARHEQVFAAALLGTVLLGTLLTLVGLLLPQLVTHVS